MISDTLELILIILGIVTGGISIVILGFKMGKWFMKKQVEIENIRNEFNDRIDLEIGNINRKIERNESLLKYINSLVKDSRKTNFNNHRLDITHDLYNPEYDNILNNF